MKKRLFLLALLACFFTGIQGQVIDVRKAITHQLGGGGTLNVMGHYYLWSLPEENRSFVFSVIISVNQVGKITDVKFAGRSKLSDTTYNFDLFGELIKKDKFGVFKKYKNSLFIVPIWIKGYGESLTKTTPEFLKSFNELIPLYVYDVKNRKTWILPMTMIDVYEPIP